LDLGERQQVTGLCGILGLLSELSQTRTVEILA
jgi:hypothetical protein